jgi:hypothetical protein
MKKLLCVLALSAFALSACCFTTSPISGTLVTDVTVNGAINLPAVSGNMVEGTATAKGILGFISGDCSYEAALKDALAKSGAKGLKNIVVDHKVKNILGIVAEYTTIVRGVPTKK